MNGEKDIKLKEDRLNILNELIQIISDTKLFSKIVIPNFTLIIEMIEINIFNPNNKKYKEENSEEYWIDIKLIYDLFF